MYDIIIIGAGPGGISAALYAKRTNLNVLVLHYGKSDLKKAPIIDNYYGFPGGISGENLYNNGIKQAEKLGINVVSKKVVEIEQNNKIFTVKTTDENFCCKALVISTGNKKIRPNIKGINEFEGKGVSYCAICDAFFFKNKNVGVIGNGEFAIHEAEMLSNIVKSVTIFTNGLEAPKTNILINNKNIKEVSGDIKVNKIIFEDGTFEEIDGVFVALGEARSSRLC